MSPVTARKALVAIRFAICLGLLWYCLKPPGWLIAAKSDPDGHCRLADLVWRAVMPGLEVSDAAVLLKGFETDSLALTRIDPQRFELSVHHDGSDPPEIESWRSRLSAVAVINGSYFHPGLQPETPIRTAGESRGPAQYDSKHAAFVACPGSGSDGCDGPPAIVDLTGRNAAELISQHRDAIVSYPLLIGPEGTGRVKARADLFANRSFVAIAQDGRVILGTSRTGFLSLPRLAELLRSPELNIVTALNLDGGPLACQSVDAGGYTRTVRGRWELEGASGLLSIALQRYDSRAWQLPIVLAVRKKED